MSSIRQTAIRTMARWKNDILAFVRECCGAQPDPWQEQVLVGVQKNSRQATVGSKGCGKTTVEAWVILWFLLTRPMSNIAVTSVSGDNLKDGLWKELALWMHRSSVLSAAFEWTQTRIVSREHPATWWVSARTWSKSADAQQQSDTLAGLHADYMMFVIDEAGSVPLAVAVTAEAALSSGRECKLIIAGNPTSLDGPLYQAAVPHKHLWHVVHVSGAPKDPNRAPRVDATWAQEQIDAYGEDNPWVVVNVFGRFPPASLNALLGVEEVTAAIERHLPEESYAHAQKRLGIDVARYGDDRTVIFPRQGKFAGMPVQMRHERGSAVSVEIANRVLAAKANWGAEVEFIDATGGWGAGTTDVLRSQGYAPIDVQFAAPAFDARFRNRRAELWWHMAQWVKEGGSLPKGTPELLGELTTVTYMFSNGKFQIEPKENVKKRIGRSPDLADALALTFGLPDMPAGLSQGMRGVGRAITDFNPWAEDMDAERERTHANFNPHRRRS